MPTFARPIICLVVMVSAFASVLALPKDAPSVRFEDLRPDGKVSDSMICLLQGDMWIQEVVSNCHFPRKPVDDALDREVENLERFMILNSSFHPTMETFDDLRRREAEAVRGESPQTCGGPDFNKDFRSETPEAIDARLKPMLSTPMAPCLEEKPADGNR